MAENQTFDAGYLRRAFGTFLTGVTIVTTRAVDGVERGMTANSFASVSLDPPLVLVCVGRHSSNYAAFEAATAFGVNILNEEQAEIAALFSSRGVDRFAAVLHGQAETGSPILTDCLSWFDCTLHERIVAGDHLVLIGKVQAFGASAASPLGFSRGRFVGIDQAVFPPNAPAATVRTGYLIEQEGQVLLRRDRDGEWALPSAPRPKLGVTCALDHRPDLRLRRDNTFLYSVFETTAHGSGCIVYRATLESHAATMTDLGDTLQFFDLAELPWHAIGSAPLKALLRRFLREHDENRFGVYVDTADGGRVAMIEGDPQPWD